MTTQGTQMTTQPTQSTHTFLRPSLLPKVAVCGSYRSDGEESEAAARGTKLDIALRALLAKQNVSMGDFTREEVLALKWAEGKTIKLANGLRIETDEENLRIECLGMEGTADVLCEEAAWSADLKSGQKRNYREQQAAYALGFMDRTLQDEWTVYLLYCDLEDVETLRFTREEAEQLVRSAIANAHDPAPPVPNEYCGWCAKRMECSARKEQLAIVSLNVDFQRAESSLLREFCLRAATVADFAERAREIIRDRAIKGEKIPGVALITKRGSKRVPANVVERYLSQLGTGEVMAIAGSFSEAKIRELWGRQMPDKPFPDSEVIETAGSTYVQIRHTKNAALKD